MTTETTPNTSAGAAAPLPASHSAIKPANRRKHALLLLLVFLLLTGGGWLAHHLMVGRWHETTDDAYVQGNIVTVTPQAGGTVIAIHVEDGMRVEAGQVLVNFDASDADVAYAQAVANLAGAVRQVRGIYRAIDAGQADIAAREVALQQAQADVTRRAGLVASGAVSAEELAHAKAQLAAAQAALSGAREQTSRNRVLVDNSDIQNNPQVLAAAAQLRAALLGKQRTTLVAPTSGYVAKRNVQLGQRVAAGTPLLAIIPLDEVWVDANFKETQLRKLRLGQPVALHSELYGKDVTFHGTLESLGLGTGSAFSLLPAQNASGNWIKIVQRVPVRIALDKRELQAHPLRLGLSMHADVDLHAQDGGLLPVAAAAAPRQRTDAYAKQLADADALIERIIRENIGTRAN
ncbi:MAG: HlyD family efflux transporter periplasmic adaptor subunit [Burkholderiaceae bacterium]|nr:MAG: HlyD family efflux transporter periplasmic adaptor subunit [Burkholderiaceae bacterium]